MKEDLRSGEKEALRKALFDMNGAVETLTNSEVYIRVMNESENNLKNEPNAMGGVNCFEKIKTIF